MPSQRELARSVRDPDGGGTAAVLDLSWADFNATVMKLSEKQVEVVLHREKEKRRRMHILLRLHSRLSRLRRERERRELIELAARP